MFGYVVQAPIAVCVISTVSKGTNRLGVPSWNEMLAFLMQDESARPTDSGVCGNYCYLKFPDTPDPVVFGDTYIHPKEPCVEYICTVSVSVLRSFLCVRVCVT